MSTPRSLELGEGVERQAVAVPKGPIAALVASAGPGTPILVLVPGFTGSKEDFAPVLAPLADSGITAVAIDQRGQFESKGPDDPAAYTEAALAGDLLALCAAVSPDAPVHVLGHSLGGLVARRAVIEAPEHFASLTLLCSGPGALPPRKRDELAPMIAALPAVPLEVVWAHKEAADRAKGWTPPSAEVLDFVRRKFIGNNAYCLRAMAELLCEVTDDVAELAAATRRADVPVLVAHGAGDDAWPPAEQAEMAERLGAGYVVIEDALHSPAVENPERTVAVLREFLLAP